MKYPTLVILIVGIAAIVAAGCTATSPATPQNATALPSGTVLVAIRPDITHYTVFMSSAPGIGLSPNITGPPRPGTLPMYGRPTTAISLAGAPRITLSGNWARP